jgi:DNA-binding transcriptional ArsR family regulator
MVSISKTFKALSDPTRRQILKLLKIKDMPAGEIGSHFDITAPSLTHHLNILKQSNLVSSQKKGQEVIYSLNLSVFEETATLLSDFFHK